MLMLTVALSDGYELVNDCSLFLDSLTGGVNRLKRKRDTFMSPYRKNYLVHLTQLQAHKQQQRRQREK